MSDKNDITIPVHAIRRLQCSENVVVLTGAGISAESGIPTFRDAMTGLWENYRAEELATPEAFLRDRNMVWGWYEQRRREVMTKQPNIGHSALATLGKYINEVTVITQNVDDLHERAGSNRILHLHGNLFTPRCFDCDQLWNGMIDYQAAQSSNKELSPPICPHCHGFVRPGVVWFGEFLPEDIWRKAERAVKNCDLIIIVGTSGLVYPAAGLVAMANQDEKYIIQINPRETDHDKFADCVLRGSAGTILPKLISAAWA